MIAHGPSRDHTQLTGGRLFAYFSRISTNAGTSGEDPLRQTAPMVSETRWPVQPARKQPVLKIARDAIIRGQRDERFVEVACPQFDWEEKKAKKDKN
jgi:hypothetical protein